MANESLTSRLLELLETASANLTSSEASRIVLLLAAVLLAFCSLLWVSSRSIARAVDDDPEKEVERALRETDRLLDEVRSRLGKLVASEHLAQKLLTEATRKHEQLSSEIDLALHDGRDDLAQAAIGSQLDLETQIAAVKQSLAAARVTSDDLQAYADALLQTRRELQAELDLSQRLRREQDGSRPAWSEKTSRNVQMALSESVSEVLARQGSLFAGPDVPDANSAVRLAKQEKTARDQRIQERLSALKAQRRAKDSQ
jgi:phage shock protein A